MTDSPKLLFVAVAAACAVLLGIAWCASGCGAPLAAQAEASYGAELQACVIKAKLTDAGRAGSKECEDEVDYRWHVATASKDGGTQ